MFVQQEKWRNLVSAFWDDISISGKSGRDIQGMIGFLKDNFGTVDLGDAKSLLGIGSKRDLNAGIIKTS